MYPGPPERLGCPIAKVATFTPPARTWHTELANLLCLCQHHHRLHHRGQLGIEGNGDEPNGVVFTDVRGRVLASSAKPAPAGERPAPAGRWIPPSGEPLDPWAIYFNEAVPAPA